MEKIINSPSIIEQPRQKFGGKQPGAGRPKGSLGKDTIIHNEAMKIYDDRVKKLTSSLLNSQLANAFGNTYIIHIEEKKTYNDNGKVIGQKKVHNIIEDPHKIGELLAKHGEDLSFGVKDKEDDEYYFMTTKKPDNKAIDSILNRTFGKATQAIVTKDDTGKIIPLPIILESVDQIIRPEIVEQDIIEV